MNVGVTGASGYVGSTVFARLRRSEHDPYELGRGRQVSEEEHFVPFSLGAGIGPEALDDLDAVVHCAYDFAPITWEEIREVNVEGTLGLFDAAVEAGTDVIQVSSLSAFEGCRSTYGRAKLRLEEAAFDRGFTVVRPGLVFGRELGGTLGGLHALVSTSPVVPVPAGGPYYHYLCHYDDLAELLIECCDGAVGDAAEPIVAASESPRSFRRILRTLAEVEDARTGFVPVPVAIAYYGLRAAESVGLRLGLRSDSVVGLVHPNPAPDFGPTRETGVEFREFGPETLQVGS